MHPAWGASDHPLTHKVRDRWLGIPRRASASGPSRAWRSLAAVSAARPSPCAMRAPSASPYRPPARALTWGDVLLRTAKEFWNIVKKILLQPLWIRLRFNCTRISNVLSFVVYPLLLVIYWSPYVTISIKSFVSKQGSCYQWWSKNRMKFHFVKALIYKIMSCGKLLS